MDAETKNDVEYMICNNLSIDISRTELTSEGLRITVQLKYGRNVISESWQEITMPVMKD